jgi:hypothetical protein
MTTTTFFTGFRPVDEALANRAAGLTSTPPDHSWHHTEDCVTIQLVPSDIHTAVAHSGGIEVLREKRRANAEGDNWIEAGPHLGGVEPRRG